MNNTALIRRQLLAHPKRTEAHDSNSSHMHSFKATAIHSAPHQCLRIRLLARTAEDISAHVYAIFHTVRLLMLDI
jgi:hypothetical protein